MMAKAVTFEAQLTIVLQKQVVDYVKFINNWFMLHYQQHAKHNKIIFFFKNVQCWDLDK